MHYLGRREANGSLDIRLALELAATVGAPEGDNSQRSMGGCDARNHRDPTSGT